MLSTIEDLLHESETMNPEPNSTLCMVNRTRKGNPIKNVFFQKVSSFTQDPMILFATLYVKPFHII